MQIFDTLEFLLGSWQVERRIEDHRVGIGGSFRGVATFARHGTDASGLTKILRFHEVGELKFGTFSGHCERSLEYIQREGTGVQVVFDSGRPFIGVDFGRGRCADTHRCAGDLYEISHVVRSFDVLEERWRVRGPTKDYDATTSMMREHRLSSGRARGKV